MILKHIRKIFLIMILLILASCSPQEIDIEKGTYPKNEKDFLKLYKNDLNKKDKLYVDGIGLIRIYLFEKDKNIADPYITFYANDAFTSIIPLSTNGDYILNKEKEDYLQVLEDSGEVLVHLLKSETDIEGIFRFTAEMIDGRMRVSYYQDCHAF